MAFSSPVDPFPPARSNQTDLDVLRDLQRNRVPQTINAGISQIITQPTDAVRIDRSVITWKTPYFGYIQMYVNPQSISIQHSKIVQTQRTKGGFVIQYGGENLDEISIDGHTGSSGMEGINILYAIYRAEQFGFESAAITLEQQLSATQTAQTLGGLTNSIVPGLGGAIAQIASPFSQAQPRPTLASLASSVELFYQGILYRGFFKNFKVDENVSKLGWFDYHLEFTSYARQGVRRNFMPWHRQPEGPAGTNNPLSFTQMEDPLELASISSNEGPGPSPFTRQRPSITKNRSVSTAVTSNGINIQGLNL